MKILYKVQEQRQMRKIMYIYRFGYDFFLFIVFISNRTKDVEKKPNIYTVVRTR